MTSFVLRGKSKEQDIDNREENWGETDEDKVSVEVPPTLRVPLAGRSSAEVRLDAVPPPARQAQD